MIASGHGLTARLHNIDRSQGSRYCDFSLALVQTMLLLHQSRPEGSLAFPIFYFLLSRHGFFFGIKCMGIHNLPRAKSVGMGFTVVGVVEVKPSDGIVGQSNVVAFFDLRSEYVEVVFHKTKKANQLALISFVLPG